MVLGAILVFVNEVLVARLLGVQFYGFYALAFILVKIGQIVSSFGLPLGVIRFIPGYRVEGRKSEVLGAILGALVFPVFIGLTLIGLISLGSGWIASDVFSEPEAKTYIKYLAIAIPFLALVNILGHITRAFGRSLEQVLIRNLIPPATFTVFLVIAFLTDAPPISVVIGFVCSLVLGTLAGAVIVARLMGSEDQWTKPKLHLRELYAYSSHVFVNSALLLAVGLTDIFVLGIFENAEQVGIYRGCLQVILIFELVAFALGAVTTPLYSMLAERENPEKLREIYSLALQLASLMVIPAYMLIALNASDILALLGPAFSAGAAALSIRALGAAIKVYFSGAGLVLLTSNRQKLETANAAIAVVLNIFFNLMLVPRYGIVGAALATTITLVFLSALRAFEVKTAMGLKSFRLSLLRYLGTCGVAALFVAYGAAWMGFGVGSGAAVLALRAVVMGSIMVLALWIFGINQEDKRILFRVFRGGRSAV